MSSSFLFLLAVFLLVLATVYFISPILIILALIIHPTNFLPNHFLLRIFQTEA